MDALIVIARQISGGKKEKQKTPGPMGHRKAPRSTPVYPLASVLQEADKSRLASEN